MKKLKTSQELSTGSAKRKLDAAIDAAATEWLEVNDACASITKRREQMRDSLIALVDKEGKGEESVSSSKYVITAKAIKGSDSLDDGKVAAILKAKYPEQFALCVTTKTVHEVNEAKLIQLVERGLIPESVVRKNVIRGGSKGTRVTVTEVR